jgi:hypothetical protein
MPPLPDHTEHDEQITHLGDDLQIAEIGTRHHPVSTPPTALDVVERSPKSFRYVWHAAVAAVLGAAFAISMAPFFIDATLHGAEKSGPSTHHESAAGRVPSPQGAALPTQSSSTTSDTNPTHEVAISPVRIGAPLQPHPTHISQRAKAVARMPSVESADFPAFDVASANAAVDAAAGTGISNCAPSSAGSVPISVTFAPSGRVTQSLVEGGALQGTSAGSCLALQLRSARVAPFDGAPATVHRDVAMK